MNDVFKFVSLRPAQTAEPAQTALQSVRYDATAKSPLHTKIEALTGNDRRTQAIQLALDYMNSPDYIGVRHSIVAAVEAASAAKTVAKAKQSAADALQAQSLEAFLNSQATKDLRDHLWDSLYAQTLAPSARPGDRDAIYAGVRALFYLERLVNQPENATPMRLAELQQAKVIVPAGVIPPAEAPTESPTENPVLQAAEAALNRLHKRVAETKDAVVELRTLESRHQALPKSSIEVTVEAPVGSTEPAANSPASSQPSGSTGTITALSTSASSATSDNGTAAPAVGQSLLSLTSVLPQLKLKDFWGWAADHASESTKTILGDRLLLADQVVETVVEELEEPLLREVSTFVSTLPRQAEFYIASHPKYREVLDLVPVPFVPLQPVQPAPTPAPDTPAARGIRPLGIGDLLMVQQNLLGYAPGEIAHIENVLKSEHKGRVHTRTVETEELLVVETETLQETERDLQSTERFELQRETERTIEEETSVDAGLSVTASYGFVSATATANFAYNQSRSEANRMASQFAKEVVNRSVSRVMERVREERTRRTLERIEEKNEHGFDNRNGTGHVIGIYRWVDKYYQARTINYGRRLMMEFVLPEPAAFYIFAQGKRTKGGVVLTQPMPPTVSGRPLHPSDLQPNNYRSFVAQYNVQGVEVPPAPEVRVGEAFAEVTNPGEKENAFYAKKFTELKVPAGYRCWDVFGHYDVGYWDNSEPFIQVLVAAERWGSIRAQDLTGTIPVSVEGAFAAFHVNLVAVCERTPEAFASWQTATYGAIMDAYHQALSDYNEQVAAAEIAAGVEIQGRNPSLNRKIERDELRKGVLRLLTDEYARTRVGGSWRFNERFNAMRLDAASGYPEFDVAETMVEGQVIQFFEQAFEWNNITYRFYPYFWGRKENWKDTFLLEDTDPQFTDFLRAGAARVIVPVHPAYGDTILHYLFTNEIWNGDQPPTLDDPLYVSIVDELRADTGADINRPLPACAEGAGYPCVLDEWEVKLPSNLVYLQPTSELPGTATEKQEYLEYIVQEGDSWQRIAQKFRCTVDELRQANPGSIRPGLVLYRGERLFVPRKQE